MSKMPEWKAHGKRLSGSSLYSSPAFVARFPTDALTFSFPDELLEAVRPTPLPVAPTPRARPVVLPHGLMAYQRMVKRHTAAIEDEEWGPIPDRQSS